MNKIKILFIITILHISFSTLSALGLNSFFSKDGNDVWAVGILGTAIHSTNGGATWNSANIGSLTFNSVCTNSSYIWIISNTGIIQVSTDGGVTWNQYTVSSGLILNSVYFINSTTGWIAGNNGSIFISTNSGLNWAPQNSTTVNNLSCITFSDPLNGLCCGAAGTVLMTSNGGSNWNPLTTPTTNQLLSIDKKGTTIIASGADRTVIKSTNNGASWSIIDYRIPTRLDINSVSMIDQNTYYSCGSDGFIRKSTDGGATFIFQINPMLADLYKIYFFDSNKGWAAGRDNNVVLSTTDGGNTWLAPAGTTQSFGWALRLSTDPNGTWGSIFSLSKQNPNEIFVCANNHIYRSLAPGQNFISISSPIPWGTAPHCLVVSPKDSNKMLVAYDTLLNIPPFIHGRIYRTSDYGVTWTATFVQDLDVDSNPIAVDPDHPDTVYLGTTDSLVYRSTDFGANWTATGPAHLGKMCSINIVKGHSNIIIIGSSNDTNSASLYRSTDYGATWNVVYTSTGANFPEIPCITYSIYEPDKLYFASFFGSPHGLYVSTNDGLNWVLNYPDQNVWGISIATDDPNTILWGYGGGTNMFYTTNAGANWNPMAGTPSSNNQSILCFNRKIIFTQQNHGIYQLNSVYNYPIGIQPISTEVPKQFSLEQNYPNPFNPATKIKFSVPSVRDAYMRPLQIAVYDVLGRQVAQFVNQQLAPGVYEVTWDASNYPSGVYFYKLTDGEFSESKKMILLK